ncbi:hypothetical protein [Streptomyces sp. NPDC057877]|uniref:hypothetical protein n=1 Tax=Streptomyces sp. NPDC057877 TaxID=3346269 RepID=UPI0036A2EBF4
MAGAERFGVGGAVDAGAIVYQIAVELEGLRAAAQSARAEPGVVPTGQCGEGDRRRSGRFV